MKKAFWGICLLAVYLSGCGYTTRSALPSSWRTIYVPPFANKIDYTNENKRTLYIPLMEVKVREGIVSRFQFDGNLKIAKEATADLILQGELVDYSRGAVRYTDNDDVQEYRIYISVNLKLTEVPSGEVVWEENGFTGEASYFLTGPHARSETLAVNDAITDLARRVIERTVENW